jgi:putative flippase GtrA
MENSFEFTEFVFRFIKFGGVGLSGMFVDFSLTWLCKEKLGMQKYVSNAIGFLAAASSNYYLNRIWTFESHNPDILTQYGNFLFISTIGLGLNTLLLYSFNDRLKINFYLAKLFATGCVMLWNFLANYFYTF